MHEQDQWSGALLDEVQAPGRGFDGAVAQLGVRLGPHGPLLGSRGTRVSVDHAVRLPPHAMGFAGPAKTQERAGCGRVPAVAVGAGRPGGLLCRVPVPVPVPVHRQ
ncbi:hypothetical protein GCM10010261_22070 [Streptomyces pilosus]|uniref:Uncharacterized protein n=1 Tax=Streptomyces pilosus TaxID=28893 RepID=A0A918C060_9ACTN|nr:hypothetical protein GCM10010280_55630 [Streptomyces pilosus]GGV46736.1 hypothetical protein GCM10010261_22070 [Streptomyces pilosus]